MIETTIGFIALGIILIIALAKLVNLVSSFKLYPGTIIAIGFIIAILCWGFYFTASMSALNQQSTWTTGDEEITLKNNDYQTLFNFFPIVNILMLCVGALTALETISVLLNVINPENMRQQYGYKPKPPTSTYNPEWSKPSWKN